MILSQGIFHVLESSILTSNLPKSLKMYHRRYWPNRQCKYIIYVKYCNQIYRKKYIYCLSHNKYFELSAHLYSQPHLSLLPAPHPTLLTSQVVSPVNLLNWCRIATPFGLVPLSNNFAMLEQLLIWIEVERRVLD